MRWIKHMTTAGEDVKISALIDQHGAEAYGIYWLLLEAIGLSLEKDSTAFSLSYSEVKWSQKLRCSVRKLRSVVQSMTDLRLIECESLTNLQSIDDQTRTKVLTIAVPKLLKYRDEYSKKSRQTPAQDTDTDTHTEVDTDIEKDSDDASPPKPKLVSISDRWFDEEFWPLWPVKQNRPAAKTAAKKLNSEDRAAALRGVVDQAFHIKAMERPIHAATWLNGRRWEDEKHTPGAREPTLCGNLTPSKESFAAGVVRRAQERIMRGESPL